MAQQKDNLQNQIEDVYLDAQIALDKFDVVPEPTHEMKQCVRELRVIVQTLRDQIKEAKYTIPIKMEWKQTLVAAKEINKELDRLQSIERKRNLDSWFEQFRYGKYIKPD